MAGHAANTRDESDDLEQALALVRDLWCRDGVPERAVAWAMMIEAVDRLTVLHGPVNTRHLLERLIIAVRETAATAPRTMQ